MRGPAFIVAIMSLFVTVGGLTATWLLAEAPAAPDDEALNVQLSVFNYAPRGNFTRLTRIRPVVGKSLRLDL